jgi:hypothetical protein
MFIEDDTYWNGIGTLVRLYIEGKQNPLIFLSYLMRCHVFWYVGNKSSW